MDILAALPKTPGVNPERLWEWLKRSGKIHGDEPIQYTTTKLTDPLTGIREKYAACKCLNCGESWYAAIICPGEGGTYPYFDTEEGPKRNGETMHCPCCGASALIAHEKRLDRYPIIKKAYPWEIRKVGRCVMFICWAVIHETGYNWQGTTAEQRNAYVIDPGGRWHRFTAMDRSGFSSMSPMCYTGQWYEARRFQVADGNFSAILPHPADVYEGTPLENAKLELLEEQAPGTDLLHYARLYMRHPKIENIARNSPALCAALVKSTDRNSGFSVTGLDWVNWKAKKPHEALYMSKPEYKAASGATAEQAAAIATRQHAVAVCINNGAPRDYADTLGGAGVVFADKYKHLWAVQRFGLVRVWNYIRKQTKTRSKYAGINGTVGFCVDYWNDAQKAGFDLESEVVAFPRSATEAQARATAAIRYKEDAALRGKFERMTKRLQPLRWEYKSLFITPAESEEQLILEGKALGHCVGGYGKEHCSGKSIFFIRHTDSPETSFFTLQLDTANGKVLHNRGRINCARTPEVEEFEKQWLCQVVTPWINSRRKTITPNHAKTAAA